MIELGAMYHWSPRSRLGSIQRLGLVPGKLNVQPSKHVYGVDPEDENYEYLKKQGYYRQDSVSFSADPATAWSYSHGAWGTEGTFDLWQVFLTKDDAVFVSPMWGGRIVEVRVRNRIHKRRLLWVGERTVAPKLKV